MLVEAKITAIDVFTPFDNQSSPILRGYAKTTFAGDRYPIILQLSEAGYNQIFEAISSGRTPCVTIEVWAKPYTSKDGQQRASLSSKLISIN